jgi:hypothetical protein
VPGGGAIRLIFRFQYQLSLAVAVLVVAALSAAWDAVAARAAWSGNPARRLALASLAAAGVWLAFEQINLTPTHRIHRHREIARLASIPSPGPQCRSFYLRGPSPFRPANPIAQQIDAMLLAERLTLPTLNGYSGFTPPGWHLENPQASDYSQRVQRWAAANGLSQVCTMQAAPDPPPATRQRPGV